MMSSVAKLSVNCSGSRLLANQIWVLWSERSMWHCDVAVVIITLLVVEFVLCHVAVSTSVMVISYGSYNSRNTDPESNTGTGTAARFSPTHTHTQRHPDLARLLSTDRTAIILMLFSSVWVFLRVVALFLSFTFRYLADAFIQSDSQTRTMEAIKNNKRAIIKSRLA